MKQLMKLTINTSNLKVVSPLVDEELKSFKIELNVYKEVEKLLEKIGQKQMVNQLVYIYVICGQLKKSNDLKLIMTDHDKNIQSDYLEFSKFLKSKKVDSSKIIDRVSFSVSDKEYNIEKDKYEFHNNYTFKIKSQEIIPELLKVLKKNYEFQSSTNKNFKIQLKTQKQINKPSTRRHDLANGILTYLNNEALEVSDNEKLHLIGYLFQMSLLDSSFSRQEFDNRTRVSNLYNSYRDYIIKQVRSKYFPK